MKDGNWDMELDYEQTKIKLINRIKQYRIKKPLYKRDKIAYTYLLVGLLQLRNGCRIGEAIEGMIRIIESNEKEVKVEKMTQLRYKKIAYSRATAYLIPQAELNKLDCDTIIAIKRTSYKMGKIEVYAVKHDNGLAVIKYVRDMLSNITKKDINKFFDAVKVRI